MEQLEAFSRTSSESGDSEEASENKNSAGDESIATGELVGEDTEEHDEEEMEADDSAGDEGRPVALHTARSARDVMMERLDRLANDFKATVQCACS